MGYWAEKTNVPGFDPEALRARIPGWGVDADPKDRPSYPKDRTDIETGAHWDFPERQPEREPRERSPEHKFLTPVFGTSTPMKGLSGAIRRYAYRHGEGKTLHWMALVAADRVDVVESRVQALASGRPDRAFHEMGMKAEFTRHGIDSRLGHGRTDVKSHAVDMAMFAGRYLAIAAVGYAAVRLMRGARPRRLLPR